ncbi:hypothetical protein T484DRAFT_1907550 [Baffinella frigidus]|nr:hypothetical protein T484DRAFT_1907550 [Cryptophyta sp. CCMP2293]
MDRTHQEMLRHLWKKFAPEMRKDNGESSSAIAERARLKDFFQKALGKHRDQLDNRLQLLKKQLRMGLIGSSAAELERLRMEAMLNEMEHALRAVDVI